MIKPNHAIVSAISLILAFGSTSCGPKGTVVRADDYDAETIVDLMNEEEPVVQVPAHAEKPHATKHHVDTTPLEGEWIIIQAKGYAISQDEDMPYIIFSDSNGKFYASNGCNILNGTYSYKQDNHLTFGQVISTLRVCPDIDYPDIISSVLKDGVTVKTKVENQNRESYLYMYSENNDLLLKLRKHNLEVINGQWEVESIGDMEVDGNEINVFFDIPEHSIHGNTGCNYFNGVIMMDPTVESSISFSQMGVTMKYCDNAETERKLLVALEETENYILKDAKTLYLTDSSGERLITLKRK